MVSSEFGGTASCGGSFDGVLATTDRIVARGSRATTWTAGGRAATFGAGATGTATAALRAAATLLSRAGLKKKRSSKDRGRMVIIDETSDAVSADASSGG